MSFLKDFHSEIKMFVAVFTVAVVVSIGIILILKSLPSSTQVKPESQQVSVDAQPTEESTEIDTSNWQTYFFEEFGFEVKYPKDWKISASSEHFILRISNQSSSAHFGVHKRERNSGSISFAVGEWTRELTGDGESAEAIPAAFTFPDDFVVATYGAGSDGLIVDKMLTTFRSLTPEEAKREVAIKNLSSEEKEILAPFDTAGKYFIELTRFPNEESFDDEDNPFQILRQLRYQSVFQNIGETLNHWLYFKEDGDKTETILLGPFETEEAAQQEIPALKVKFPTAKIQQGPGRWNIHYRYHPKEKSLLFSLPGYLPTYAVDKENEKLLYLYGTFGFEGDRYPGTLWVIDGKKKELTVLKDISGFVLLPSKDEILIARGTLSSPSGDLGYSVSVISAALAKFNLSTGKETPLGLSGGEGGIFMTKDGGIYVSHDFSFGNKTNYSRFDLKTETLTRMSDEFRPPYDDIVQPLYPPGMEVLKVIADAGSVKLIEVSDFDGESSLYINIKMKIPFVE